MKQTPMKVIRLKCLDCCGGQVAEVRRCTAEKCPLFCYRMGHRPKQGKDTTPEHLPENAPENRGFFVREGACENG